MYKCQQDFKEHFLHDTFEEMPPQRRNNSPETDTEQLDLYALFESEDEDRECFDLSPNTIQN